MAIKHGGNEGVTRRTLAEILEHLDQFNDEEDEDDDRVLTIYASKQAQGSGSSEAVVCYQPDDGSIPDQAEGLKYLLEVFLAKDAIRVWSEWRQNAAPATQDRVDAVLYYATHNAYLPLEGQEGQKE